MNESSPVGSLDRWRAMLRAQLKDRPTPLLGFEDGTLPAASLWMLMRQVKLAWRETEDVTPVVPRIEGAFALAALLVSSWEQRPIRWAEPDGERVLHVPEDAAPRLAIQPAMALRAADRSGPSRIGAGWLAPDRVVEDVLPALFAHDWLVLSGSAEVTAAVGSHAAARRP